jgi:hypothetical protein
LRLIVLVSDPDGRQELLGTILRERYPKAVALGETNATTGELVEAFNEAFGIQGDTARKAIAFYLQAAKYAGNIPLSPNFKTPTVRTGAGSSKKRGRPPRVAGDDSGGASTTGDGGFPAALHPALAGLLGDLPKRGETWTKDEHDRFKTAFDAILPIAAPISDETDEGGDEDENWPE